MFFSSVLRFSFPIWFHGLIFRFDFFGSILVRFNPQFRFSSEILKNRNRIGSPTSKLLTDSILVLILFDSRFDDQGYLRVVKASTWEFSALWCYKMVNSSNVD